jgi:multidrug efflux pump subunit AcrA (membrane-fusion protein)
VSNAAAVLDAARVDLERTQIRAPFDAVVQLKNIDEGDFAQAGRTLVELVATDRLFVRASLPVGDLKHFPNLGKTEYPARLMLTGDAEQSGKLYKLLPGLSEQGHMARLLIAVNNPFSSSVSRPMLLGEVVRVELSGRTAENVSLISRKHLRDGSAVWMIDAENKLRICPAETVQGSADRVLVRFGFSKDWKLITSNIAAPVDGMTLKTVQKAGGGS